jgi:tetratricopeptide (TPR) repeat protein
MENFDFNSEENYQKIRKLLLSDEETNIKLGLKLLLNFRLSPQINSLLLTLIILHNDTSIEDECHALFSSKSTPDEVGILHKIMDDFLNSYESNDYDDKVVYNGFLEKMSHESLLDEPLFDVNELANALLEKDKDCIQYCLQHQTASTVHLLHLRMRNGWSLNLHDCELKELPKEVGELTEITHLNISFNPIQDLPDELANLKKLQAIGIKEVPLTQDAFKKLEKWFPKMMATHYYDGQFSDFFSDKDYKNALFWIDKCLDLNALDASYWNAKGVILQRQKRWDEALVCLNQSIEIDPDDPLTYANKALNLHETSQNEASLEAANAGLAIFDRFPSTKHWKSMLYFRKGQALYHLNRLEESEEAYLATVQLDPNDGGSFYNLACIYILWKERDKVIEYLKRAITCNEKFWDEAHEDTDFEDFWKDEDFWELVKR